MDQSLLDAAIKMEEVNTQSNSITDKQTNIQANNKAELSSFKARQPTFEIKRKIEDSPCSLVSNKLLATNKPTSKKDNEKSEETNSEIVLSLLDTIQRMEEGTMPPASVTPEKQNKSAKTEENTSDTRQSLFDTVTKMDEDSNSSVSSPLLGNQSKNVTLNNSSFSRESRQKSSPMKKKATKKITDYFSKKST